MKYTYYTRVHRRTHEVIDERHEIIDGHKIVAGDPEEMAKVDPLTREAIRDDQEFLDEKGVAYED